MDAIRKIEVVVWRCFHCDEAFTDEAAARDHFGRSERQSPVCQIDATEYRKMEARMLSYNEEDSEMHRQIYRMESSHAAALKAEEEKGYARGLADGAPYLAEREAVIATHTQTLASKEAELVRLRTDASRAQEVVRAEPVAVIGDTFSLFWVGSKTIAELARKHNLKVGDKLYTAPPSTAPAQSQSVAGKCCCDHHEHCSVCQPSLWLQKSITATPAAEQGDAKDARLEYCYQKAMGVLLKPCMTKQEWLDAIDAAILASKPTAGEGK